MTDRLEARSVQRLFQLAGECRELQEAGEESSRHFLAGLAHLTRSKVAVRMNATTVPGGDVPVIGEVDDVGWPTESDRARVYDFVARTPIDADSLTSAVFKKGARVVTLTRADTLSTGAWARTEVRNDVHRPSGIDDSLLSLFRESRPGRVRVLAFKRAWGQTPFGDDERAIIHVAHTECGWAFERPRAASEPLAADWSARERETFALLLTGARERDVAATLGISAHAVRGYVKRIYRRLGVRSRREMLAAAFEARVPRGHA